MNRSDFVLIFIPWFLHEEYRAEPPEGWEPPPAFVEYGAAHGLDAAQLRWAWTKNGELAQACGASPDELCWLFRQEYPATSAEAFQMSGHESYSRGELVLKARRFTALNVMAGSSRSISRATRPVTSIRSGESIT